MAGSAEALNFYFVQNGYLIVEQDANYSATYQYTQYTNRDGKWYLMRSEIISSTLTEYKYCKGDSAASTAWTNRASKTYGTPDSIFKDL
jgi:hypothetical protein